MAATFERKSIENLERNIITNITIVEGNVAVIFGRKSPLQIAKPILRVSLEKLFDGDGNWFKEAEG